MITLNDYLYDGDTILKILQRYTADLKESVRVTENQIDMVHCDFLMQVMELLQHNDFLASQSQRIRDFYKYMAGAYPYLAFTFKGRIKSLIRAEEKFNGYVVEYVYDHYREHGSFPSLTELKERLSRFRDLIAYRIVISLPKCHLKKGEDQEEREIQYLYQVANRLPAFLEERGFTPEQSCASMDRCSSLLMRDVRPYYRDYVANPSIYGYRSLHITFYDNLARCYVEVQLRTKAMDDYAEIGPANHLGYEKRQERERVRRAAIPEGEFVYFDEAYQRGRLLQELELSKLDVNMFAAVDNSLINDGCGLFRGRQILPYEHLSRFQNDLID
ncbi:MAG: guanosine polyphosphate pyrophosphohydrolase [Eubacteriales bacterium]|nr:guanosine polyphosphate pyrophosphohydrolase [Eubacteriales bacterium]